MYNQKVLIIMVCASIFFIPVTLFAQQNIIHQQHEEVDAKPCPELLKATQNTSYTKSIQAFADRKYAWYCTDGDW